MQLTELVPLSDADKSKLSKLFAPLNDVVIVAVDHQEKTTPGGIILPEATNANMQPQSGTVVAVGEGARSPVSGERIPLSLKVGDRVIFGQYAGNELRYGTVHLKAMREPDVLTIVADEDALQPEGVRVRKSKPKAKAKRS